MSDHLQRAREYIAIAESADAKRDAYERAADEIIAWVREEPTRTYRDADKSLGRGNDYTGSLVRWRTSGGPGLPFARRPADDSREAERLTERTLRDAGPEVVSRIIDDLPPERRSVIAQRLLADPNTRSAMVDEPEGMAAVESMHHTMRTRKEPVVGDDPLPPPPAFASSFWRAVSAVDAATVELERFGVTGLDARADTRAAAERMTTQAARISESVVDYVVENIA